MTFFFICPCLRDHSLGLVILKALGFKPFPCCNTEQHIYTTLQLFYYDSVIKLLTYTLSLSKMIMGYICDIKYEVIVISFSTFCSIFFSPEITQMESTVVLARRGMPTFNWQGSYNIWNALSKLRVVFNTRNSFISLNKFPFTIYNTNKNTFLSSCKSLQFSLCFVLI